jgi:hypothetical protein
MSFTPEVSQAGIQVRQARADQGAADLALIIAELQGAGVTNFKANPAALNQRRVPTPWGHRHWHPMQVTREASDG